MGRRLGYDDWQEALAQHFFDGRHVGRAFWLFVDGDVAASLGAAAGAEDGFEDLRALGCSYVGSESGAGIFAGSPLKRFSSWLSTEDPRDPPPVLPVLALSVLAASHMHEDEEASQTNYYRRFRELLELKPSGGMPAGFDSTVVRFWRRLRGWAALHVDQVGRLVIPDDPYPPFVGYPISQALWRQADTDHLAAALWDELGDDMARQKPQTLVALARHHVVARKIVPIRAQRVFSDERFEELRGRVLEDIAGSPPPPETEAARRVRSQSRSVMLQGRAGPKLHPKFVVERHGDWPATLRAVTESGEAIVARSPEIAPGFYALDGYVVSDAALAEGFELDTEYGTWRFEPQDIYVLAPHDPLGLATSRLESADRAVVVAPSDYGGEAGWPRPFSDPTLPPGWSRFDDVRPETSPEQLQRRLEEATQGRLDLEGGLAIRPRVYLRMAPPAIVLPAELRNETVVRIEIDDETFALHSRAGRLLLNSGLDLDEGSHTIRLDGHAVVSFELTDGLAPACRYLPEHATSLEEGNVMGAYLEPPPAAPSPRPVVASSRADEVLLIGSEPGQVQSAERHEPPRWLKRTPVMSADFEVRPDFDVIWVIERKHNGDGRCRLVEPRAPTRGHGNDQDQAIKWAEAVLSCLPLLEPETADPALVEQYMERANEILDGGER